MLYATFPTCPMYTLQGVPVLLKSGYNIRRSITLFIHIYCFLIGEYGLNSENWECSK